VLLKPQMVTINSYMQEEMLHIVSP